VEERMKKAMAVMGQVWGIGKRFGGDWRRRVKLFDWLVGSVVGYGAKMWGWKEWEKVEATGKILKVGVKSRWEDAGVHDEGGKEKREDEDENGEESDGV